MNGYKLIFFYDIFSLNICFPALKVCFLAIIFHNNTICVWSTCLYDGTMKCHKGLLKTFQFDYNNNSQ